jgi:hypothetical protein
MVMRGRSSLTWAVTAMPMRGETDCSIKTYDVSVLGGGWKAGPVIGNEKMRSTAEKYRRFAALENRGIPRQVAAVGATWIAK